jgi:hypothetical protein
MGLRFTDLFDLEIGEVYDLLVESMNDRAEYNEIATQSDMDNVFR